jgi:hypothetical protein
MVEVAALERCCHRAATKAKTDAAETEMRATLDTALEGNGLTSRSDPSESSSVTQPGNVPRRTKQKAPKMMLMNLRQRQMTVSKGMGGGNWELLT